MQSKKVHIDTERNYRLNTSTQTNEQQIRIILEESDIFLSCTDLIDKNEILSIVHDELYSLRQILKSYILIHPEFQTSLIPIKSDSSANALIQEMLSASSFVNIGPFAAVAGTVSEYLARKISNFLKNKNLPNDVLVENGGDIFIISQTERVVALLDKPQESLKIGLVLQPTEGISLCASSSTIGHSLSFGNAELVTILATKGSFADCMATACCNMLKSKDDFQRVLSFFEELKSHGLLGIFASCDNEILAFGEIKLTAL